MSKSPTELYMSWLKDAHAMETFLNEILEHRVKDAEGYPQVRPGASTI
jgi:ferritin-like metal-binding protein YciE